MIIVGTIGKSSALDELSRSGKIDLAQISGTWESLLIQVVPPPCLVSAKPSSLRGATSAVPSTGFTISPNRSVCRRGTGGLMRRNFFGITYYLAAYRSNPQLAAMRGPRTEKPRETDPREGNPVYNAAYLRVQKGSVR